MDLQILLKTLNVFSIIVFRFNISTSQCLTLGSSFSANDEAAVVSNCLHNFTQVQGIF